MIEYRTLRVPFDLVPLVKTALEARAHDFEGSNLTGKENVNSTVHRKWIDTASALRKLVKELEHDQDRRLEAETR